MRVNKIMAKERSEKNLLGIGLAAIRLYMPILSTKSIAAKPSAHLCLLWPLVKLCCLPGAPPYTLKPKPSTLNPITTWFVV
jgi:hypothetical protein